jgi:hypothetical protein
MFFSHYDLDSLQVKRPVIETIHGAVIAEKTEKTDGVENLVLKPGPQCRVTPLNMEGRQKNWVPWVHGNDIYLAGQICPHQVYRVLIDGNKLYSEFKYHTEWTHPMLPVKGSQLRGGTNAIRLDNGSYLGILHTASISGMGERLFYDSFAYQFEGKPPFKMLAYSSKTILPAESARVSHFRKGGLIQCVFSVGLVRRGQELLISSGLNDSAVRVDSTTIDDVWKTLVQVPR